MSLLCLGIGLGVAADARTQADPQNFLFNSGQTIQPFFEGWAHNPDGSIEMHFGYLNRNYVEELHVPVGADNRVIPEGPDRGQPTYFYPRVNRRVFSVTVPANWGDRELVWQVTVNDETYRAVGWLQAEWEIFATPSVSARSVSVRLDGTAQTENQPPTLTIDAPSAIGLGETLALTARVSDDGLPEPRRPRGGGQGRLPTFEPIPDGPTVPVNVPQIQTARRKRPTRMRVERVNVTWMQLRGPTGVTLEASDESQDGTATVTATIALPGEYRFRVRASDNLATATEDVSVTVR